MDVLANLVTFINYVNPRPHTIYVAMYMFSYLQGLFYYIRRHIYSSKL